LADISVDKQSKSLDISNKLDGYTRVLIRTGRTDADGNEVAYIAGNEAGRTLEIDNPWANQTTADKILAKIQGWAYQPLKADSVKLPPAYELGDSITVNNVFSGIYNANVRFSHVFAGDVEAPLDKEIDHEYQYEDSRERKYTRSLNDAIARLNFFADSIEAKVDKVNENTTFGWRLTENGWTVFNQSGNIFSVAAGGASVTGEIKANSGSIGGFTIGRNGISTNNQSYGGQETTGIFIGASGIQLGTNFRVDSQGNLYASSGNFDGNVYAKNIKYNDGSSGSSEYGYLPGGAIQQYSIAADQLVQSIRNSLGFADLFNDSTASGTQRYPQYFTAGSVNSMGTITGTTYYVRVPDDPEAGGTINRHTHYGKYENGKVTIGAPDFTGSPHPFDVAGSATVSSTVVNGTPTYQSSYNRYAVPVKVTLSNGNTSTTTLYVNASAAYNAGVDSVDVNWSDGDYDIWIYPFYYDAWEEINGGLAHAKLTNGKERTVRLNW